MAPPIDVFVVRQLTIKFTALAVGQTIVYLLARLGFGARSKRNITQRLQTPLIEIHFFALISTVKVFGVDVDQ
jgi:hypothetical protein